MNKLTRRQIESKLPKGYGIDKTNGFWYFNGPDCHKWNETCTFYTSLNDVKLEKWIDDFTFMNKDRIY